MAQNQNHFESVVGEVESAPPNKRTDQLIQGIVQQMTQSGNQQTQQLGQELNQVRPQLVRACQQQAA